jgi:2-desacetyl-2-hydroxyethyl bacteriochlorophyllide A dehydrogenase
MEETKMKAVRYYAPEQPLIYEEAPMPKIGPDEVLVKVQAAGICHTDLHFLDGVLKPWKGTLPLTLGHEIAGDIVSVGKSVKSYNPKDRVVLANVIACGKCDYCKSGRENLCSDLDQIGFTTDGGYAEYVNAPEKTLVKLPDNVSYEVGSTLTCAAASCYHAIVDIAQSKRGETILLNGFGGLGSNALQIAKYFGLKVIAVDVAKDKLKMAEELGAEKTIDATSQNVQEEIKKFTNNKGIDIAIEFVGRSKTIENAFKSLGKTGRLVFVGYTKDTFTFSPIEMVVGETAIKGSVAYTKKDLEAVVKLASEGKLHPVVSEKVQLKDINRTLEKMRKGEIMGRAVAIP